MKLLRYSISAGTSLIRSRVLPLLRELAVDQVRSASSCGSGTSAASTSQGPSTVQPSRFFTRRFGRYQFSR